MPDLFTSLPRHQYVWLDKRFVSQGQKTGPIRASWFGLHSVPGRAWGLDLLLENGATYINLPPHSIAFAESEDEAIVALAHPWTLQDAQKWDAFGYSFAVHIYDQLADRDVDCYTNKRWVHGEYLFSAQHFGDSFSMAPDQAKQFHFIKTEHGRLTSLPGNCCLFHDPAFTKIRGKPDWLRVQREVYACESGEPWDKTIGEETA